MPREERKLASAELRTAVAALDARMDRLAETLCWKLECIDPSDGRLWPDMDEDERDSYRGCVEALMVELADEAGELESVGY